MSERTETLLRSVFTETIQSALVAAISSAYDLNMERYAPEVGDDAMLFGLMNYKSKVPLLNASGGRCLQRLGHRHPPDAIL